MRKRHIETKQNVMWGTLLTCWKACSWLRSHSCKNYCHVLPGQFKIGATGGTLLPLQKSSAKRAGYLAGHGLVIMVRRLWVPQVFYYMWYWDIIPEHNVSELLLKQRSTSIHGNAWVILLVLLTLCVARALGTVWFYPQGVNSAEPYCLIICWRSDGLTNGRDQLTLM